MGRFDGILICSDVDGTLAEGKNIPEKNLEALRYFQSEGGLFTLATGRPAGYESVLGVPLNAPVIT
ncbi:MAG: HAD hydrolase family protein, partial [Clostridia bacterium]|nr:HAD hydrolase family protein [Clostridia bacterium]